MPLHKHRSVADLGDTGSVDPRAENLGKIISEVWEFNTRLAPATPVRGISKFRTVEELNQHRKRWKVQGRSPSAAHQAPARH